MPSVVINEKDYTIYNAINDSNNIVYVPGFSITGPYDEPTLLSSYADLIKTYGDMPPTEYYASGATNTTYKMCTSWEYAAQILNKGFPVLFQRIAPLIDENGTKVVDDTKMVSASLEFRNTYEYEVLVPNSDPTTTEGTIKFKIQDKFAGTYGNRLQIGFVVNNAQNTLYLKVWDTYSATVLEYIKICTGVNTKVIFYDNKNVVDRTYLFSFASGFVSAIDSSDYLELVASTDEEDPYATAVSDFNDYIMKTVKSKTVSLLPSGTVTYKIDENGWVVNDDGTISCNVIKETVTVETTYVEIPDDATYDGEAHYYNSEGEDITSTVKSENFDTLKAEHSLYEEKETPTEPVVEPANFNDLDFDANYIDRQFVNVKNLDKTSKALNRSLFILGELPKEVVNLPAPDDTPIVAVVGKDYTYNDAVTEPEYLYTLLKDYLELIADNILYDVKFITKGAIALGGGNNEGDVLGKDGQYYNNMVADFCARRGDCVSLLEPAYMYGQDDVPEDFMSVSGTPSTYVSAYAPWCVLTLYNGYSRWCPPSLVFLTALENSVEAGNPVYLPPAGVNRATVTEVVTSEYKIGSAVLNKWQDKNELRNINPIMQLNNYGYVIFGQRTLYDVSDSVATYRSALQEFGVRLMVIECKKTIRQVATGLLFEYNNIHTWNEFKAGVRPLFETMVNNGAIQRYQIIMDATTTSPYDIDENKIRGIIKVVPGRAVEDFVISFELYRSDVTFDDEEIANERDEVFQS